MMTTITTVAPTQQSFKFDPGSMTLDEYCEDRKIIKCDQKRMSDDVIFVAKINDDFKKIISDALCLLKPSGTVIIFLVSQKQSNFDL